MTYAKSFADATTPRPRDEWGEDDGDVLWWILPVEEPPFLGTRDEAMDEHTHWTPIAVPGQIDHRIRDRALVNVAISGHEKLTDEDADCFVAAVDLQLSHDREVVW